MYELLIADFLCSTAAKSDRFYVKMIRSKEFFLGIWKWNLKCFFSFYKKTKSDMHVVYLILIKPKSFLYLQMASTKLADTLNPGGKGAKNSLLLYLVMINLSLSSCEDSARGLGPFNFCSHRLLANWLPKACITAKWPGGHSSRSRERTRDMCDPSFRCTPEHSMQIRTPKFMLAQSGSV